MRIGVIGTGTIAAAMVRGIAGDGHEITVSERGAAYAAALSAEFDNVQVGGNQTVLDQSDTVFLCLMAETAANVLPKLRFRPDQQVISLMSGASLEQVGTWVAPARAAAIMMPFPAIAQGGSAIMALGDTDLVSAIFAPGNTVYALDSEDELAAYLCAQAVLSPATRMVADAADWLAGKGCDAQQGERFLRHLVSSSLSRSDCASLIEALNTPGGFNQRLRLHMEAGGMSETLRAGLDTLEEGS